MALCWLPIRRCVRRDWTNEPADRPRPLDTHRESTNLQGMRPDRCILCGTEADGLGPIFVWAADETGALIEQGWPVCRSHRDEIEIGALAGVRLAQNGEVSPPSMATVAPSKTGDRATGGTSHD